MIDARKFSFSKLPLPKTDSILTNNAEISVGYFDLVNVSKVNTSIEDSLECNKNLKSCVDRILSEYCEHIQISPNEKENSKQNIFAFTNQSETEKFTETEFAFSTEKLKNFWDTKEDITHYYSLLHINFENEKDVLKLICELNKIFNKGFVEYRAVFYFSFDYSDIIICAKNMIVSEYTRIIFNANYFSLDDNRKKTTLNNLIKDSFSLLTINNDIIQKSFDIIEDGIQKGVKYDSFKASIDKIVYKTGDFDKDKLTISYNIGVQDYTHYNLFLDQLNSIALPHKEFRLLGRHDAAIYNGKDTNLSWLIIVLYFVDKYSVSNKKNHIEPDQVLFNCESFIRIVDTDESNSNSCAEKNMYSNKLYTKAKSCLEHKIIIIDDLAKSKNFDASIHINALNSFSNSIVNTLKNGFAEDFIICIYEPFISFLDYVAKIIEKDKYEDENQFENLFNSFFEIVSSLVNSAMHSDRQFIQTPSFSPVFFDVPPKLMAFYTSITKDIIEFNRDKLTSNKFSFVFKPDFSHNISVSYYSYQLLPPVDRLLSVSINEKSLYKPYHVLMVLCHEIAHYVGKSQRAREERKEYLLKINLFFVLKRIFSKIKSTRFMIESDKDFDTHLSMLIRDIVNIEKEKSDYKENEGYSGSFNKLLKFVIADICLNKDIEQLFQDYLFENISNKSENIGYLVNELKTEFEWISHFIPYNNNRFSETDNPIVNEFNCFYDDMLSVFSEIYADIQMILLTGLTLEDYLNTFVYYENLTADDIKNNSKIYYRIFNIVYYFVSLGIWELQNSNNDNTEYNRLLSHLIKSYSYYRGNVFLDTLITEENIKHFGYTIVENTVMESNNVRDDKLETYINSLLLRYIDDVFVKTDTMCASEDKYEKINDFRGIISMVNDFDDSASIFYNIQKINENYLNNIIKEM